MTKLTWVAKFTFILFLTGWVEYSQICQEGKDNYVLKRNELQRFIINFYDVSNIVGKTVHRSGKMLFSLIYRDSEAAYLKKSNKHNFASVKSGAKVISSQGILGPSSALSKDKDKYLSFRCRDNYVKASMVISLEEDAFVEVLKFHFLESYNNFVRDFEVYLSISGAHESWVPAGIFRAKNNKPHQTFKLSEPKLARTLKIIFKTAYNSFNHYCTITQIEAHGKTYMSHTTEKTARRIREELSLMSKQEEEKKRKEIDSHKLSLFQMGPHNKSDVENIKNHLMEAVQHEKMIQLKMNKSTCPLYQDLYLAARNQSSVHDHFFKLIVREGPLESYYEMLSRKISVIFFSNFSKEN